MLFPGTCAKCGSSGQRYYDTDRKHKHRALKCFTCGNITHYLKRNGTVYTPPPWEADHEPAFDTHVYGANRARTVYVDDSRSGQGI